MEKPIRHILMPVLPDESFLPVVKQVAQLAADLRAKLYLLYIGDPHTYQSFLPWGTPKKSPLAETKEKMILLNYWKSLLEDTFRIQVETDVQWGRWRKTILQYAVSVDADIVVLHEASVAKPWFSFYKANLEYVIEKSPCQVLTLISGNNNEAGWQQVVIPVTDFVPELRIQAILKTAISKKIKVHWITLTSGGIENRSNDFYFLTETLKRLKPAGNLQVECRCLRNSYAPVDSFLNYAHAVGADLLMTRMSITDKEADYIRDINFHVA
jgi:hypothetical protein